MGYRKVVVVGSFIMDLVIKANRRPNKGETIVGESFGMYIGGKGTNQAIAAARLGSSVHMIGCLGNDTFGKIILDTYKRERINTDFVIHDPFIGTGVGTPVIDKDGENSIIIVPQANMMLTPDNVEVARKVIAKADVLLIQLEIPIDATQRAAEIAKNNDTVVILNPAPASEIPETLLNLIDILIPNKIEAEMLSNISINDDNGVKRVAEKFLSKGIGTVIITLGEKGSILFKDNQSTLIPSFPVNVVDTTGAGDAYCGALAASIADGKKIEDAVYIANASGALAVTKMGAEPSLPTWKDIKVLMG